MERNTQVAVDKELEHETSPPPDKPLEREQPLKIPKTELPDEDFAEEKPSPIPTQTYGNELTGEKSKPYSKISESDSQTLFKKAILTTECSWKETVELAGNSADLTQWIEHIMKAE
ncbi:hypothetical protein niasHS_009869 [Heterodera schachtii]|uniref:Uncharacterized protein n=1 Tax=Heterodera schachtii TaxID=97005 RepID=A0ABD2J5P9_HETSC